MSSVVYFLQDRDMSIKIGCTAHLSGRLKALRRVYGEQLQLLAVTPGTALLESRLHREFADDCIGGEWFKWSDRLVARIADLAKTKAPTEPVSPFDMPTEGKAQTYAFVRAIARELIELRGVGQPKTGCIAETAEEAGVSESWLRKLLGEQEGVAISADAMLNLVSLYRRRLSAARMEAQSALERYAARQDEAEAWLRRGDSAPKAPWMTGGSND